MSALPAAVAEALVAGWGLEPAAPPTTLSHGPLSTTWRLPATDGAAYAVTHGRPGTAGGLATARVLAGAGVPGVAAPVATADGAAHVGLGDGRPVSVAPWLEGRPALEVALERRHWVALGETVGRAHEVPAGDLPRARRPDTGDLVARLEDVRRRVVAARTGAAHLGRLRLALREHARGLDRAARLLLEPAPVRAVVACHGDLHLGNVLLVEDRPVVLDWEDAGAAPRELDLLFVVDGGILERRVGEDELDWFTRGYGRVLRPDRDELHRQRTLRVVEDLVLFAEAALDESLDLGHRVDQADRGARALGGLRT